MRAGYHGNLECVIHSDNSFVDNLLHSHFNIGLHYGFVFMINCINSFYNESKIIVVL